MREYAARTTCRLCGGLLVIGLTLGETPLANEYPASAVVGGQETFPLSVGTCSSCGHAQLSVAVNPERLFRAYAYQSGTSSSFREHLKSFATAVAPLEPGALVVEIGSNDGTLLAEYACRGFRVLGVDPARNLAAVANDRGIATLPEFFTVDIARQIHSQYGAAALVVANNVFAHADDLSGIAAGVEVLLSDHGRFVFEVGYLPDVVERGLFDVIYHEHVSYHHLRPLVGFLRRHGLDLYHAERNESQGGSVRCFVRRTRQHSTLTEDLMALLELETPHAVSLARLNNRVQSSKEALRRILDEAQGEGLNVAGYGAPAKLTTMMYACELGARDVAFVVDDNPLKIGKVTPGLFLPILSTNELLSRQPDVLCIFSWNFADDIMLRCRALGYRGKYLVPAPKVRLV